MEELNFGKYIRKSRMELGLSLSEVAADLGCSAPYLSGLETGKQKPSETMLKKISTFLQLDINELSKRSSMIRIENALNKVPIEDIKAVLRFYQIKHETTPLKAK